MTKKKPRILDGYVIRAGGHTLFHVDVIDGFDLAATLHRRFKLSDGIQVRLKIDQEAFTPTQDGTICYPDGRIHKRFQVIKAEPKLDCQPARTAA